MSLPAPGDPVGFADDIKPLFRERDREAMQWAFDLWAHDDVAANADAILAQVESGTMPCDSAWPPEQVVVFERWVAAGKPA